MKMYQKDSQQWNHTRQTPQPHQQDDRYQVTQSEASFSQLREPACPCEGDCPSCLPVQKKSIASSPGDRHEQEADSIAANIQSMPRITQKNIMSKHNDRSAYPSGKALSSAERQFYESRLGFDFSQVRIHDDAAAQQTAHVKQAHAFTQGNNIVMGAGAYDSSQTTPNPVLAHELVHVVQQQGTAASANQNQTPVQHQVQTNTIQCLSIDEGVKKFKKTAKDPGVVTKGQFYIYKTLIEKLEDKTKEIINAHWSGAEKLEVENYTDEILTLTTFGDEFSKITKWRGLFENFLRKSNNPSAGQLLTLLGDGSYRLAGKGQSELFNPLWKKYQKTRQFDLTNYMRYDMVEGIRMYEKSACKETSDNMGTYIRTYGYFPGALNPAKELPNMVISNRNVRVTNARTGWQEGDVVEYKNLSGIITQIKEALDADYMVNARALSGVCDGYGLNRNPLKKYPSEEHSLNILGYDGDTFVFWDPDAEASQKHGGGFGYLYYDASANRLTTARNSSDMEVNVAGVHRNGQHRYQILRVWSV